MHKCNVWASGSDPGLQVDQTTLSVAGNPLQWCILTWKFDGRFVRGSWGRSGSGISPLNQVSGNEKEKEKVSINTVPIRKPWKRMG